MNELKVELTMTKSTFPLTSPLIPARQNEKLEDTLLQQSCSSYLFESEFADVPPNCQQCGYKIQDNYFLKVDEYFWHENCLNCCSCHKSLVTNFDEKTSKCYFKDNRVYCYEDYHRIFNAECAKCKKRLNSRDIVFRCLQSIFHCYKCGELLKKNDKYFYLNEQLVCQKDYHFLYLCNNNCFMPNTQQSISEIQNFVPNINPIIYLDRHHNNSKKIPKRPRTILNTQQRKAFKYAFDRGPKPSRKVREQLANDTGLSVRVVQVWFQNQRAKVKKDQRKRDIDKHSSFSGSFTISTDSDGKSGIDDGSKSALESLRSEDSDNEDLQLDEFSIDEEASGRSSTITDIMNMGLGNIDGNATYDSTQIKRYTNINTSPFPNPIDKLYQMQQAYFDYV